MSASNEPGIYTKGDSTKVADTAADAVALKFDGYTRVADASDEQLEAAEVVDEQSGADTGAVGDVPADVEVDPVVDVPAADSTSPSTYQF